MNEKLKNFVTNCIMGGAILGYGGLILLAVYHLHRDRKVEAGYVKPSKLEIYLKDVNGNGTNETLMEYDGQSYLLKLDEEGRPTLKAYEIQPAQIKEK